MVSEVYGRAAVVGGVRTRRRSQSAGTVGRSRTRGSRQEQSAGTVGRSRTRSSRQEQSAGEKAKGSDCRLQKELDCVL